MPAKEPGENESEIEDVARRHGIDYSAAARKAVRGDAKAQKEFFSLAEHLDGAAAESFAADLPAVFHLIGDEAFASFLREQSLAYRIMVRNSFIDESVTGPFEYVDYLQRHFPKTAEAFFRKEIVDWPSPDGGYVIRNSFFESTRS